MGLLCFIYMICSLRTNIVFFIIFLSLVLAFSLLSGAFWHNAKGNVALAGKLQIGGGACTFVTSMAGWYIFFVILLASVDFPLQLPLGDLSTMIKGASEKVKVEYPHSA
jgi:succinate-acetate transporter protein